jgi:hypothetical protein
MVRCPPAIEALRLHMSICGVCVYLCSDVDKKDKVPSESTGDLWNMLTFGAQASIKFQLNLPRFVGFISTNSFDASFSDSKLGSFVFRVFKNQSEFRSQLANSKTQFVVTQHTAALQCFDAGP